MIQIHMKPPNPHPPHPKSPHHSFKKIVGYPAKFPQSEPGQIPAAVWHFVTFY